MYNFFKQKTAYEMSASLVGSEMCIRDRRGAGQTQHPVRCLLYTSDAADD
ncbi:hypothetical protein JMUB7546_27020 [Staphylococcus aureus]